MLNFIIYKFKKKISNPNIFNFLLDNSLSESQFANLITGNHTGDIYTNQCIDISNKNTLHNLSILAYAINLICDKNLQQDNLVYKKMEEILRFNPDIIDDKIMHNSPLYIAIIKQREDIVKTISAAVGHKNFLFYIEQLQSNNDLKKELASHCAYFLEMFDGRMLRKYIYDVSRQKPSDIMEEILMHALVFDQHDIIHEYMAYVMSQQFKNVNTIPQKIFIKFLSANMRKNNMTIVKKILSMIKIYIPIKDNINIFSTDVDIIPENIIMNLNISTMFTDTKENVATRHLIEVVDIYKAKSMISWRKPTKSTSSLISGIYINEATATEIVKLMIICRTPEDMHGIMKGIHSHEYINNIMSTPELSTADPATRTVCYTFLQGKIQNLNISQNPQS